MLLVARGNTSRQIGETLFISPRTVEMHVQGSLLKLQCRTRAEAVRRLAELGTLPPGLSGAWLIRRPAYPARRGSGLAAEPSVLSSTTVAAGPTASAARRSSAPSPVSAARAPASVAAPHGPAGIP